MLTPCSVVLLHVECVTAVGLTAGDRSLEAKINNGVRYDVRNVDMLSSHQLCSYKKWLESFSLKLYSVIITICISCTSAISTGNARKFHES